MTSMQENHVGDLALRRLRVGEPLPEVAAHADACSVSHWAACSSKRCSSSPSRMSSAASPANSSNSSV